MKPFSALALGAAFAAVTLVGCSKKKAPRKAHKPAIHINTEAPCPVERVDVFVDEYRTGYGQESYTRTTVLVTCSY